MNSDESPRRTKRTVTADNISDGDSPPLGLLFLFIIFAVAYVKARNATRRVVGHVR